MLIFESLFPRSIWLHLFKYWFKPHHNQSREKNVHKINANDLNSRNRRIRDVEIDKNGNFLSSLIYIFAFQSVESFISLLQYELSFRAHANALGELFRCIQIRLLFTSTLFFHINIHAGCKQQQNDKRWWNMCLQITDRRASKECKIYELSFVARYIDQIISYRVWRENSENVLKTSGKRRFQIFASFSLRENANMCSWQRKLRI